MKITLKKGCKTYYGLDNILILTHRSPDGDTLGSAYALKTALAKLDKKVYVLNDGEVPKKYSFMLQGRTVMPKDFNPDYIIAVDTAEAVLLGSNFEKYGDKVDLCIDHHISNSDYAKYSYVDAIAAATERYI
jgi:phosphoesterase RecJ-like protein